MIRKNGRFGKKKILHAENEIDVGILPEQLRKV